MDLTFSFFFGFRPYFLFVSNVLQNFMVAAHIIFANCGHVLSGMFCTNFLGTNPALL